MDVRLAEYLFPCGGGWNVMEADGRVGWLGRLGRHWGPVVCVSWDGIEVRECGFIGSHGRAW